MPDFTLTIGGQNVAGAARPIPIVDQPLLTGAARGVDDLRADRARRHGLGQQQRNQRTTHAKHRCHDEDAARAVARLIEAQHIEHDGQHEQHCRIGDQKKTDTHHDE